MDLVCGGGPASLNRLSGLLSQNIAVSKFPEGFGMVVQSLINISYLSTQERPQQVVNNLYHLTSFTGFQ